MSADPRSGSGAIANDLAIAAKNASAEPRLGEAVEGGSGTAGRRRGCA
jgi:hypothetical protein